MLKIIFITICLVSMTYAYTPSSTQKEFGDYIISNSPVIECYYAGNNSLWVQLSSSQYDSSKEELEDMANLIKDVYVKRVGSSIVVSIVNQSSSRILAKSSW
jgi:hypothetical protein